MPRNSRNARREPNTTDAAQNRDDIARNAGDSSRRAGEKQNAKDEAQNVRREGTARRNVSNEPLPELSEEGGIEPLQENPADYHDRTRDRELDER
jgi:hypothetical protein